MKLVPVFVLVALWVGSSSSPVKTEGGILATLSSGARYIGRNLHIIKKRQLEKVDSNSKDLKSNAELALANEPSGSEQQSQTNETERSNRTKRAQGSDDPRYILVHDVPPCKKRRSAQDYEQPAPPCSTQSGKNITIIIQNSMDGTEKHRLPRAAETAEISLPSENAADKTNQVQDVKLPEATETVAVDSTKPAGEVIGGNSIGAEEFAAGRKLLWGVDDEGALEGDALFLPNSPPADPHLFNFFHGSEAIDKSLNDQQQDFKADQKRDENAEVVYKTSMGASRNTFCVCIVTNAKCSPYVTAFRAWEESDIVNCTRACSKLADCSCEVPRANPIKSTDSDVSASEHGTLDPTMYMELAWIIIFMLNILVIINTIVMGYVCWKGPDKKKSVFLVSGYANTPPARA